MNVVVLGSTGMAGHLVAQYLQEQGYHVFRASRSEKDSILSAKIDVRDTTFLKTWLDDVQPNVIVNCIGLLQKACDARPDLAVLVNAYFPHWLEHVYAGTGTKVIHLSTDCVFSGDRGGYREDDLPDGRIMYDRSKALGELQNDKDLTFRMSIIGPDIDPEGTGLFNWFMQQHGEIQGFGETFWNGVTTVELARAIDAAIRNGLCGLYQLVPTGKVDKCSLLELIQDTFGLEGIHINRVAGPRMDKSLVNTRTDFPFTVQPYEKQIADMSGWVLSHHSLYPHYER